MEKVYSPTIIKSGENAFVSKQGNSYTISFTGATGVSANLASGLAAEQISARQVVYKDIFNECLNGSDKWYLADYQAVLPIKLSPVVGFAVTSANSGDYFYIQSEGNLSGFSDLFSGSGVWLANSGSYTQLEPIPNSYNTATLFLGTANNDSSIQIQVGSEVNFIKDFGQINSSTEFNFVSHWQDKNFTNRKPAALHKYNSDGKYFPLMLDNALGNTISTSQSIFMAYSDASGYPSYNLTNFVSSYSGLRDIIGIVRMSR